MLNIKLTYQTLLLAIVGFLVITAWDEVLDRFLFEILGLDRELIRSWMIVALISTMVFVLLLLAFRLEAHDILGISETVDQQLTRTIETKVSKGEITHEPEPTI